MVNPVVSIVIPCFNASLYINETLDSVQHTTEGLEYEVIIVNDGSTDDTENLVKARKELNIRYFAQQNSGVSAARNNGLLNALGKYIIFFDADDLMSPGFLAERIAQLEKQPDVAVVCGPVTSFNKRSNLLRYSRGAGKNAIDEIATYDADVTTCPSNYLIRHDFIKKNNIKFDTRLSSTADRFFLLQCAGLGKLYFNGHLPPLMYRVDENSMSHKFSEKLVFDNERYIKLLETSQIIPVKIRKKSFFLNNFILFASYYKLGRKFKAMEFVIKCLKYDPFLFAKKCLNRIDL